MAAILIIEDDQRIRESLAKRLSERGHDIETVITAMDGVQRAVSGDFDVVVLDLGLPDVDGTEALRMIRSVSQVPVVVATARDEESDIIAVLDAGADDYVVKPYSADHLAARVRAVMRRTGDQLEDRILTVGGLTLDLDGHEATLDGDPLELTARAFDLLAYLAGRPGKLVSKRELMAEVWRQPYGGADKTVDVHVSWLRKALGETAADPVYLHTRRGVGVRLVDPTG
jgi:DNA-binding response OmpR family regulator